MHHVQITVSAADVGRARDFYCGVLQLPEISKPEALHSRGGFWLKVGERQVHVGVEEDVNRAGTKAHIAYHVTQLAQWRMRLDEHGMCTETGLPIPHHERFEFRDPFGNRVELIEAVEDNI